MDHPTTSDASLQQSVIDLAADQVGANPAEVTPETRFVEDLAYDSLDTTEFVMNIEDEFGVNVPDEQVDQLRTVGAVIDWLQTPTRHDQ